MFNFHKKCKEVGNKTSKQLAAEIAAETDVKPVAAAAVPTERVTLATEMTEIGASRFTFAPPKKGVRGSLGLFDAGGGLLEVWTCSETITKKLMAIEADATLTEEAKRMKANRYAYTLVIMWVTPKKGDDLTPFRMLGESRDFSEGFSF